MMLETTSENLAVKETGNWRSQRNDAEVATLRFGPGSLLAPDVRARLSRLRPLALASHLAFDFGLIAFTAIVCEYLRNPGLYVFGVMIIGGRQAGIGSIGLHDGVHRVLCRNRWLNDLLGRSMSWMVCTTILTGFDAYREHHFDHHRGTNTEEDPDHEFVEKVYNMPRWAAALLIVAPLTGVLFLFAMAKYMTSNWRRKPLSVLAVFVTTATLVAGWFVGYYPVVLIVSYWFVPLATWGVFTNQIRALAEHYPENEFQRGSEVPHIFRTRDIINSWFDELFLVTRGLNFHLSHHLCPQVPFYNLRELQRELAKSDAYQQYAHVTHGYHRFFAEYFFQRPVQVGGPNRPQISRPDAA